MVSKKELYLIGGLDFLILIFTFLYFKQFVAVCFDEEFLKIRGLNANYYYILLLCIIALTVVVLIQVVGLILVIALLTIPAAIANRYVASLVKMMVFATFLGALFSVLGFSFAYSLNLPAGSTIILTAALGFVILFQIRGLFYKGVEE